MPESLFAPAVSWRAFLISALLALPVAAAPTSGGSQATPYVQFGAPDQAEGRRVLAQFRQAGIAGEYYLEFDLRVLPRRGDEQVFHGKLWGGRNGEGAVVRVAVADAAGHERRLLIQSGENSAIWRSDSASDTPHAVESFEPLVPGVELTAFELQMPFLYWPDAVLEGVQRIRSRPAHVFLFRPTPAWAAQHPEISGVRAYLDTQFNAPVQTELLGPRDVVLRTLSLVDLQKIGDQYIVKSIDLRNETTRNKTRFQVTGAAVGLEFSRVVFEPVHLSDALEPPAAGKLVRVAP